MEPAVVFDHTPVHPLDLDRTLGPLTRGPLDMQTVDGVGPWTAAEVEAVALGDADAVSLGDEHLKNVVAYAFTGTARGTDARMLDLLAPFKGHRGRVCSILMAAGIQAPRFGPRRPLRAW
jgi:3-methyladenine DNA glycosylase/8-oxoguanine DNA glycosylase